MKKGLALFMTLLMMFASAVCAFAYTGTAYSAEAIDGYVEESTGEDVAMFYETKEVDGEEIITGNNYNVLISDSNEGNFTTKQYVEISGGTDVLNEQFEKQINLQYESMGYTTNIKSINTAVTEFSGYECIKVDIVTDLSVSEDETLTLNQTQMILVREGAIIHITVTTADGSSAEELLTKVMSKITIHAPEAHNVFENILLYGLIGFGVFIVVIVIVIVVSVKNGKKKKAQRAAAQAGMNYGQYPNYPQQPQYPQYPNYPQQSQAPQYPQYQPPAQPTAPQTPAENANTDDTTENS